MKYYDDDEPVVEVLDAEHSAHTRRCIRCAQLERENEDLHRKLRAVVEEIGYDIRQLARCPKCNSIDTLPFDRVHVGSRFICKKCSLIFYLIRTLEPTADGVKRSQDYHDTTKLLPNGNDRQFSFSFGKKDKQP